MLEVLDGRAAARPGARRPRSAGRRPGGDRRAQRLPGPGRRHRHQPVPDVEAACARRRRLPRGRAPAPCSRRVRPRRAARRPGQLRRDLPSCCAGGPTCSAEHEAMDGAGRSRRALAEASRRGLRRRRRAGRGHHADRRRAAAEAAAAVRAPGLAAPSSRPRSPPPAWRSRGRPTAATCCAGPAWSTPAARACRPARGAGDLVTGPAPPGRLRVPAHRAGPTLARLRRPGRRRALRTRSCTCWRPTTTRSRAARRAGALGDSLVVVGGDGLWNVHVHVDDAGRRGRGRLEAGRPHRIRVAHFAEQIARARPPGPRRRSGSSPARPARAGRACSRRRVRRRPAGAGRGARRRARCWPAIRRTGAPSVVVLPNDSASTSASPRPRPRPPPATTGAGGRLPTRRQVQGLAALAVHDPPPVRRRRRRDDRGGRGDAGTARSRSPTAEAITTAGLCQPGDVLGLVDGDFAVVGADLRRGRLEVVDRLLAARR